MSEDEEKKKQAEEETIKVYTPQRRKVKARDHKVILSDQIVGFFS